MEKLDVSEKDFYVEERGKGRKDFYVEMEEEKKKKERERKGEKFFMQKQLFLICQNKVEAYGAFFLWAVPLIISNGQDLFGTFGCFTANIYMYTSFVLLLFLKMHLS